MILRSLTSQGKSTPEFRLAIIAIVVFVAMAALSPDRFLSSQNIVSMAFQFPEFAILALAMTITMMTGGIDLSVVGVANLTAVISALILVNFAGADITGAPALLWLFVALGVAITVGGLAGLLNGILVALEVGQQGEDIRKRNVSIEEKSVVSVLFSRHEFALKPLESLIIFMNGLLAKDGLSEQGSPPGIAACEARAHESTLGWACRPEVRAVSQFKENFIGSKVFENGVLDLDAKVAVRLGNLPEEGA